jgi:type VI protein secretion system component VasF
MPARDALLPLICLYDEWILVRLVRLSSNPDVEWGRLQADPRYVPNEDGGDLFFEMADDLVAGLKLHDPTPERLAFVLEAYRFCLEQGFEGRHAGDAAALGGYKKRLFEQIRRLRLGDRAPPGQDPAPLPVASRPGWQQLLFRQRAALSIAAIMVVFAVFFVVTRWL